MRPKVLRQLERIARQELDEARRALAAAEQQRAQIDAAIERERSARPTEITTALTLCDGARVAGSYWRGSRQREATLAAASAALAEECDHLREQVIDRLGTARRYELHGTALEREQERLGAARELAVIEDAARSRRGHEHPKG
jgi:hypothetical protein